MQSNRCLTTVLAATMALGALLLTSAEPAAAATRDAPATPSGPAGAETAWAEYPLLALGYFDAADLPAATLASMQLEVERLMEEAGVPVRTVQEGQLTAGGGGASQPILLRLVILDRSPSRWGLPPNAMGVRIGKALPPTAVQLFAPVILRAVGITNGEIGPGRHEDVGRAFARVAVHEVVHAFAPDHRHGGWGILGHEQDRDSLTRGVPTLDADSARALVAGVEKVLADVAPRVAVQPR